MARGGAEDTEIFGLLRGQVFCCIARNDILLPKNFSSNASPLGHSLPMTDPLPLPAPPSNQDTRWKFVRDVVVFEMKLALNNLHNFFQIPLTIAVALFDLVVRGKTHGERFYKVVEMGRTIDDAIDIYSIVEHRERVLNKDFTVDAVLGRIESVIVREFEKGGTATSMKQAVDKAIDEMQAKTGEGAAKAAGAVKTAAEKLHEKMQKIGGDAP